jgi:hypothetical protein
MVSKSNNVQAFGYTPAGSAVLNLLDKGIRSRLGSDWTKRRVYVESAMVESPICKSYVLTADGLDNVIWRSTQKLRDDGELVDVVLSGEQRLALEHLCENAARAPDVDLDVVLLPREHDLGCSVVSCRDVSGHLGVLYTGEAEVADLEIAVLVHEDVAGLQVTVNNTGGVDVFETALGMLAKRSMPRKSLRTRIWYRKYWMNCFSSGLEVSKRWRSVPSSSVTK